MKDMTSLDALLRSPIRTGRLTIIDPDDKHYVLGGKSEGPEATIRIKDKRILRRILVLPDLYLGEGYMDDNITIETG